MVITSPSYFNNKFTGVLLAIVDVEQAKQDFIEPLKIYKNTQVFITDLQGNIFLGSKDLEGKNLMSFIKKESVNAIISREEDVLKFNFVPNVDQPDFSQYIAFKTLRIGDQTGKIIIMNRQNLIEAFLLPITFIQRIGLLLIILGFIGGGILFVFTDSISHKEGFLKGYESAIKELKESFNVKKK